MIQIRVDRLIYAFMKQIFSALVCKLKQLVQIFKLTKPANRSPDSLDRTV